MTLALFFPSFLSLGKTGPGFVFEKKTTVAADPRYILSREEYEEHMAFETSFSFMSLGTENAGNSYQEGYFRYRLGDDGLIDGLKEQSYLAGESIPPFPLEKLMDFLLEYNNNPGGVPPAQLKDWIFLVLILTICVPGRLGTGSGYGKKKKTAFLRDRQIAA
jgi:hypothetical protein